jgi:hypothetical protein
VHEDGHVLQCCRDVGLHRCKLFLHARVKVNN